MLENNLMVELFKEIKSWLKNLLLKVTTCVRFNQCVISTPDG